MREALDAIKWRTNSIIILGLFTVYAVIGIRMETTEFFARVAWLYFVLGGIDVALFKWRQRRMRREAERA